MAVVGLVSIIGLVYQLRLSNRTNQVSIRGQLYQASFGLTTEERTTPESEAVLSSLWALIPQSLPLEDAVRARMELFTADPLALAATTPADLYSSAFSIDAFQNPARREETAKIRKVFLHAQNQVYHVHNAFDYHQDGVLTDGEWETWRGSIRELHGHPMLLAGIWQQVLRVSRVGLHDDFFELGGDSRLAIEIIRRANAAGVVLDPLHVFEKQTIAELVEEIAPCPKRT